MKTERAIYISLFAKILNGECSLNDVKNQIDEEKRSFVNMLFMTALRQLHFIKTEIFPQFIKKKIPNKHRELNFIIYLAVTELLFLNTPVYAVVDSYTEIAKHSFGKFEAHFINALLRNIARNKDNLLQNRHSGYFSPEFMKILSFDYSFNEIVQMERFADIEAPLDVSVKSNCPLIKGGVLMPTGSIRLPHDTKVTALSEFQQGLCWVQDISSALPVKCLSQLQGKKVLDLCAAPGGKTAQLLDAGAHVTAVDISEKRLNILKENMERLHFINNLETVTADALNFESAELFDIILVDAPCSATGTYRRHPEIMHLKTIDDVFTQAKLQEQILEHCILLLKPAGIIVYSTCSLAKSEGEQQILTFIEKHPEFRILPIKLEGTENMQTAEGFLRVLPGDFDNLLGNDGFFVATLQRKI